MLPLPKRLKAKASNQGASGHPSICALQTGVKFREPAPKIAFSRSTETDKLTLARAVS